MTGLEGQGRTCQILMAGPHKLGRLGEGMEHNCPETGFWGRRSEEKGRGVDNTFGEKIEMGGLMGHSLNLQLHQLL